MTIQLILHKGMYCKSFKVTKFKYVKEQNNLPVEPTITVQWVAKLLGTILRF